MHYHFIENMNFNRVMTKLMLFIFIIYMDDLSVKDFES